MAEAEHLRHTDLNKETIERVFADQTKAWFALEQPKRIGKKFNAGDACFRKN